jgi:hypothetical protein
MGYYPNWPELSFVALLYSSAPSTLPAGGHMQSSKNDLVFNHDLLANPNDLEVVRTLYPTFADALYHQELIDYFRTFNDPADDAKRKSTKMGTWAILLGGAAIVIGAVEVAIRVFWAISDTAASLPAADVAVLLSVGSMAALFGLASVFLGVSGTLFGRRKEQWLINRFMGERLRQFHFQSLIAQLPLIVSMADGVSDEEKQSDRSNGKTRRADEREKSLRDTQAFVEDRQHRFIEFKANFDDEMQRKAKFGVAIGPGGDADWSLCAPNGELTTPGSNALISFFKAYRQLRLLHQFNYANYKLTSDSRIFSSLPARQSQLLTDANKLSLQFVILVHVCVLLIVIVALFGWISGLSPDLHWAVVITPIFFFAIMALAVISLCAHAFAQGLQPEREIERYQQYGSIVKSILDRFDEAADPKEKINIMWQMERAAFDEMRNFLVTYYERASFAM